MALPKVAIVAVNDFGPFQLAVPCAIFGNFLPGIEMFDCRLCAGERGAIRNSLGMSVETAHGLDDIQQADVVVLPFWRDPSEIPNEALLESLRIAGGRGALLVGLCLGAYIPAYAGLLKNKRASTHWEVETDFRCRFPDTQLDSNALFVDDGGMITSAGTGAGIDCCLYVVEKFHGATLSHQIARRLVVPPPRQGMQSQVIIGPSQPPTNATRFSKLLDELRATIAVRHDLASAARRVNMSKRSFTRHFFATTGLSFGKWLELERLRHCQALLETSKLTVDQISGVAGFASPTAMRKCFRKLLGSSPRELRHMPLGTAGPTDMH